MAWLYIAVALALAVWFQLDADVYTTLAAKARASRAPPASPPHSVAWITGASSGIGEAVAYDMCRARAHSTLVLSARRGDVLSEVAAKCAALSGGTVAAHVVPFDVTDHEAMEAAVEAVLGEHAQVDVLCVKTTALLLLLLLLLGCATAAPATTALPPTCYHYS